MEAVSPYMEMASTYLVTPYGVAALAGVILVRFAPCTLLILLILHSFDHIDICRKSLKSTCPWLSNGKKIEF